MLETYHFIYNTGGLWYFKEMFLFFFYCMSGFVFALINNSWLFMQLFCLHYWLKEIKHYFSAMPSLIDYLLTVHTLVIGFFSFYFFFYFFVSFLLKLGTLCFLPPCLIPSFVIKKKQTLCLDILEVEKMHPRNKAKRRLTWNASWISCTWISHRHRGSPKMNGLHHPGKLYVLAKEMYVIQ